MFLPIWGKDICLEAPGNIYVRAKLARDTHTHTVQWDLKISPLAVHDSSPGRQPTSGGGPAESARGPRGVFRVPTEER
jgi:hypothetical protein